MGLSSKQEVNWVECSKYVFAFAHTYSIHDACNQMHLNTIQRTNWQLFRKVRRQLQCRSLAKYLCFAVWWTDFRKQFMKSKFSQTFKVDTLSSVSFDVCWGVRVRDDHFTDWVHELNWFEATVNNLTYQASLMHGWALNHTVFPTQNGHLHGHKVKLRKACWVYWTSRPSISSHVLSAAIVWEESLEIILCKVTKLQTQTTWQYMTYDNMHSLRKGRKTPKKCKTLRLWKSKEHGMTKPTWLALEVFYPCSFRPTSILTLTCPLTQVQRSAGMYFKSMPSSFWSRQPG